MNTARCSGELTITLYDPCDCVTIPVVQIGTLRPRAVSDLAN